VRKIDENRTNDTNRSVNIRMHARTRRARDLSVAFSWRAPTSCYWWLSF